MVYQLQVHLVHTRSMRPPPHPLGGLPKLFHFFFSKVFSDNFCYRFFPKVFFTNFLIEFMSSKHFYSFFYFSKHFQKHFPKCSIFPAPTQITPLVCPWWQRSEEQDVDQHAWHAVDSSGFSLWSVSLFLCRSPPPPPTTNMTRENSHQKDLLFPV